MTAFSFPNILKKSRKVVEASPGFRRPWKTILVFLAPALFLYFAFILYPVFRTFYNSFHVLDMAHGMSETFVGSRHYVELLTDDKTFRMAAAHSLIWGFVSPFLEIPLALLLAMILYGRPPLDRFFRIAWFKSGRNSAMK